MRITHITRSPEPCVEAGWSASQWHLDTPVSRAYVERLRPLGTLLILELSQPFFKVESHHYQVKGLLGACSIRVACHRDHEEELEKVRALIEG